VRFDVRTIDGGSWVVEAPNRSMFEDWIRRGEALEADPTGTESTGWTISGAHVVSWRVDE
jgi:hypothetical protein